jgi:hypothetical protein
MNIGIRLEASWARPVDGIATTTALMGNDQHTASMSGSLNDIQNTSEFAAVCKLTHNTEANSLGEN